MTPRQEADEAVLEFAALIAQRDQETSGHRKPPTVTVTESVMDPQPFDLELDPQALSKSSPGRGGGGTTPPTTPCCSTPTLVCDSISASLSKCGFTEYGTPSDPPIYYLTEDYVRDGLFTQHRNDPPCTEISIDAAVSQTNNEVYNPDDCTSVVTSSASSSAHASFGGVSCTSTTDTHCWSIFGEPADFNVFCSNCAGSGNTYTDSGLVIDSPTSKHQRREATGPSCTNGYDSETWTLSSEYTTAALIANTEAALPSYPETWDGTCLASRDLSDDESSYSIQRFKYKFTWADPLPADCKISWIERTYDSDGNPVSDTLMSETVLAGETESTVYEVMEPADNGTVGVVFPIGGCCTSGVCSTTDETTCTDGGGTFHTGCKEDGCSPDPC